MKYYRGEDGFVYQKCGENGQTVYLDCMNEPGCTAGARLYKGTGRVETLGTHSDEKPNENVIMRIQFEAFLKMQAQSAQHSGQSVLNLYKNALDINFKGIWLPSDHKGLFLAKLRRIRKYELQKQRNPKPRQNHVSIVDASTSPITPNTIARAVAVPQRLTRSSSAVTSISPCTPVAPVASSSRVVSSAGLSVLDSLPSCANPLRPMSLQSGTNSRIVSNGRQAQGMANVSMKCQLCIILISSIFSRFFSINFIKIQICFITFI